MINKSKTKPFAEPKKRKIEMLEKLTAKQEAKISVYRDEWIKKGTCTEQSTDADFQLCREAVEALVEQSVKDVIVCDSPDDMVSRGADKDKIFSESSYGQWEASWLSYYKFFRDECGIELDERLQHFLLLAQHTCWVYVEQATEVLYLCRKPVEVHMVNGLLNRDDGPSVLFKDGFSVYSLEGHRVTEQIVMQPSTLTIEQIHSESNADIQAIMVDRYGWENYVEKTGCELLDSRHNDIENTVEALYNTERFGLRLFCTCPTGRVFVKGVNRDEVTHKTCEAAQNWLSGYSLDTRKKFVTIGRT
jgi:hypothetical protein